MAVDGPSGLAAARRQRPDVVLMDLDLPGLSGHEVLRQLKADPATAEIPVIFLTAKTEQADEQQGFDLGAVDYITKPISPPILLARVNTHLALKATADFLRDKSAYLEREVALRTAGRELTAVFRNRVAFAPGAALTLAPDPAAAHLFDKATGQRL